MVEEGAVRQEDRVVSWRRMCRLRRRIGLCHGKRKGGGREWGD